MAEAAHVHDIETDHEYDGIREFDNPLPRWWLLTFWGSIVFAMFYWFAYHSLGNAALPGEQYQAVKAKWEEDMLAKSVSAEELQQLAADPASVAAGAEVFANNCKACHLDKGQGSIGPNLTDAYWIHGSGPVDIYKTIALGVTAKGMPAWRPTLGDKRVREAVAYVLSIKDTNVEGKAPEGVNATGEAAPAP